MKNEHKNTLKIFIIFLVCYIQLINCELNIKIPPIEITVGKVNSSRTQIPKNYYNMAVCKPKVIYSKRDTLGDLFTGDIYHDTVFEIPPKDTYCIKSCKVAQTAMSLELFEYQIDKGYSIPLFINKVPIGLHDESTDKVSYKIGIPIGYREEQIDDKGMYNGRHFFYVYNHYKFNILYNEDYDYLSSSDKNDKKSYPSNQTTVKIVGATIMPFSIKSNQIVDKDTGDEINCSPTGDNKFNMMLEKKKIDIDDLSPITFTYDVVYTKSNIQYSSRWDHMLHSTDDKIHWRPIILSIVLIFVGTLWVLYIFLRSVDNDIIDYNIAVVKGDMFPVETSWKKVCFDVFRAPANRVILCSMIGTGVQVSFLLNFKFEL